MAAGRGRADLSRPQPMNKLAEADDANRVWIEQSDQLLLLEARANLAELEVERVDVFNLSWPNLGRSWAGP